MTDSTTKPGPELIMPTTLAGIIDTNLMNIGGVDGARTRDPRRDRPVF